MLLKVDQYTSLARAVACVDRGSYEARGAVYDRALTALVKRLNTAVPPYSQADIEMELLAFREAVRRVEFGDLEDPWLRQQDERLAAPAPAPIPPQGVLPDVASPGVPASAVADPSQADPPMPVILPQHRSVFGRVAARASIAGRSSSASAWPATPMPSVSSICRHWRRGSSISSPPRSGLLPGGGSWTRRRSSGRSTTIRRAERPRRSLPPRRRGAPASTRPTRTRARGRARP